MAIGGLVVVWLKIGKHDILSNAGGVASLSCGLIKDWKTRYLKFDSLAVN